jgi:peroxiredoxin
VERLPRPTKIADVPDDFARQEPPMSLQEKLDAFKADFESDKAPPAAVEALHRSAADLIKANQTELALGAGEYAPDFSLPDGDGKEFSSESLLRKGPLVVTFYRGFWCPYCNMDLQAIEAVLDRIKSLGVSLVAISPQTQPYSRKVRRDNRLSFPVLSDHGGAVAESFGVRWGVHPYLRDVFKQFKIDLPSINGEPSWTLPMPSRYVIDRDGVIAYAEVNADYTSRPNPSELFPMLDRLNNTRK